jgi:hypothetical protein
MCLLLMGVGCQRQSSSHTPLARFDNTTLTAEDIHVRFDSSQGLSGAQLQQYVQRWLKDELLYREALARGLGNSKDIDARLEDVRRQLIINEFLEKEIYNEQTARATPDEVSAYYEAHKAEFVLRSDVVLISYVVFSERDAANRFRNSVLRGTPWTNAVQQLLLSAQQAIRVLTKGDSLYHTQASLLPPDLWRVAASASPGQPSFPIATMEGYYVLIVWQMGRQGQPANIHFVDGEIRNRLAIERRSQLYDSLVENLRAKHSVEILISTAEIDTARPKPRE